MKKFLLGTVALVALAAPASAADLAARPYTKAPVAAPIAAIYDWSGFYIGANGGWGSSHKCWDRVAFLGVTLNPAAAEGCHDATGGLAGGQIGYRWQAGTWVFGLEAQGDWADLKGSHVSLLDPTLVGQTRIDAIGMFTGQIGYAANNVLFYLKGGAAVTADRFRVLNTAAAVVATTADDTRWGGVVGGGLEFGFAPGWSAGVEYDHLFMQDRTYTFVSTGVGQIPLGVALANERIRQDVDMVTVRVNYRWGGPAVAKY